MGGEVGEELGGVERGESVIGIYYIRKKLFSIKLEKKWTKKGKKNIEKS